MTPTPLQTKRAESLIRRCWTSMTIHHESPIGAVYFGSTNRYSFVLATFVGRAWNVRGYHYFGTAEAREQFAADWIGSRKPVQRPAVTTQGYEVGSILTASWGWEQTNVDFYQVTRRIGATGVELRPLKSTTTEDRPQAMAGYSVPHRGQFDGPAIVKRITGYGVRVKNFKTLTPYAKPWDGQPQRTTWYG